MEGNPGSSPSRLVVLLRRSVSTVGLWAVVAAVLATGKAWACLVLGAGVSLLASVEYFRMLRAGGVPCFPRFGVLLAAAYLGLMCWRLLAGGPGGGHRLPAEFDAAAVFVAMAGAFVAQLRHPVRGVDGLLAVGANLLGFVYLVMMFGFALRLLVLPTGSAEMTGLWLALWGVAVTKVTDMGAYLVGSAIGRHKMIPHVSPGKTWQGFAGALVFAQLAGCGLFAVLPGQLAVLGGWWQVVVLGLVLSLLAVVGDLAESVLKRSVQAKDSGGLLPGIGGAMDLIDSLCFTMPVMYFYVNWMLS
jgi:phosphatidate cytidylyltransferase